MRRIRIVPSVLLSVVVAACASSSSSPPASASGARPISTGVTGSGNLRVAGTDPSTVHTIPFAPDRVWRSLPAVFDSIGIPVAELDPPKRTMGNSAFKVRGRLKNVPLSRYLDCGTSTQIGPNADSYEVNVTLRAEVRPAEAGAATLVTTFEAVARPANFAQAYSQCASKGALESRFVDLVKGQLKP